MTSLSYKNNYYCYGMRAILWLFVVKQAQSQSDFLRLRPTCQVTMVHMALEHDQHDSFYRCWTTSDMTYSWNKKTSATTSSTNAPSLVDNQNRRKLMIRTTGKSTILVLRITAPDSQLSLSASLLSDRVFGTHGNDSLSFVYQACSHSKLAFQPAMGTNIVNGVGEIKIPINVTGMSSFDLENTITTEANAKFGVLSQSFDHVIYCMPPGTSGTWKAYGYVGWYRTVFNNDWCGYPSALVHEIGHNLGMLHSGKGNNEYGDQSGLMGYSYGQGNAPAMCFNGAKHAHLGWYDDRTAIVNPFNGAWNGTIAAFVDYTITSKTQFVIVIVGDLYLQYNRATKFNADVKEKRNTITITRAKDLKSTSLSLAGLNSGESFLIANYTGTVGLIIEVCQLVYGTNGLSPDYALVSVYLDTFNSTCGKIQSPRPTMSPTRQSTIPQASPNSNKAPTRLPTLFPTKSQTKSPTRLPTLSPTLFTTRSPTRLPTRFPSKSPSRDPTSSPTNFPSKSPIKALTGKSIRSLTWSPSHSPTLAPTHPTMILTISPISPLVSSPTSAIPSSVNPTSIPSSTLSPSINHSTGTSNTPSIWQSIPSFRSHQGCNTDEILLQLSITTSNYPGETYWTIKDASVALMTGGPYTQQNETYNISNCIPDEEYLFIIQATHKDGFGESGHYTLTVNDIILQSDKEFLNYSETVILPECLMGYSRCTVDVTTGVIGSQNSFIVEDFDGNTLMSGSGYGPYEYRSKASCIADSACIKVVFESTWEIGTLNNLSVWYNGTNFSTSFDDGRRESAYIGSSCGVALVASN